MVAANNQLKQQQQEERALRLRQRFTKHNQGHVFLGWDGLNEVEREGLLEQLEQLPIETLAGAFARAMEAGVGSSKLIPLAREQIIQKGNAQIGLEAIRAGQVAVLTLAGGQGSRLGSSDPKGCYDIGLPSHKSLFQLQAERLRRLATMASSPSPIPWYIMTSPATHQQTVDYFLANGYFGLDPRGIRFFPQGVLPAFSLDGQILMSSPGAVALAPNGNGGVYEALIKHGILEDMLERGIRHVHLYCVDNCLVRPADPAFIGGCVEAGTDCSSKAVLKIVASEPVGVFCRAVGREGEGEGQQLQQQQQLVVAEYSELSPADAELRESPEAGGGLVYGHANIANHYFSIDFLQRICNPSHLKDHLISHVARKKIPAYQQPGHGMVVKVDGIKLEQFIFDTFRAAQSPTVYLVDRREEFAPLKNAPGSPADGPEQCRRQLLALHQSWWRERGVERDLEDSEISPLISYAGEGDFSHII